MEENINIKQTTQADNEGRFDAFVSLQPPGKVDLFGSVPIRSISFDETEIIEDILRLHIESGQIELDPTYSTGNFYKKLSIKPKPISSTILLSYISVKLFDNSCVSIEDGFHFFCFTSSGR